MSNEINNKPSIPAKPAYLSKSPIVGKDGIKLPAGLPSLSKVSSAEDSFEKPAGFDLGAQPLGKVINIEDTYQLPSGVKELGAVVSDDVESVKIPESKPEGSKALIVLNNTPATTATPDAPKAPGKKVPFIGLKNLLNTNLNGAKNAGKGTLAAIFAAIATGFAKVKNAIKTTVEGICTAITTGLSSIKSGVSSLLSSSSKSVAGDDNVIAGAVVISEKA